jgi:hypothetical protein
MDDFRIQEVVPLIRSLYQTSRQAEIMQMSRLFKHIKGIPQVVLAKKRLLPRPESFFQRDMLKIQGQPDSSKQA